MDLTLLLDKADFKDYADLPESLDMDRMRRHILAAQLNRLVPILTAPLFNELLRRNVLQATGTTPPVVYNTTLSPTLPAGSPGQAGGVVFRAAGAQKFRFDELANTSGGNVSLQITDPSDGSVSFVDFPSDYSTQPKHYAFDKADGSAYAGIFPGVDTNFTATTVPAPLAGAWGELRKQCVPVLANASLARYWPFSQTTVTSHSTVRKTSQYSEPVDDRTLARQALVFDGDALTYEVALQAWLKANAASFTGFYPQPTACGATQPGRVPSPVVQAIHRPADRFSPIPYGR
jgi:hypothetical protein